MSSVQPFGNCRSRRLDTGRIKTDIGTAIDKPLANRFIRPLLKQEVERVTDDLEDLRIAPSPRCLHFVSLRYERVQRRLKFSCGWLQRRPGCWYPAPPLQKKKEKQRQNFSQVSSLEVFENRKESMLLT